MVFDEGTRYQTPFFIKTGPQSGPTVVVVGGLHGDETAAILRRANSKNGR
jgi:predicted deacylase